MSKKIYKIWVYIVLIVILFLSILGRIFWENRFGSIQSVVKNGSVSFDETHLKEVMYSLNGEWLFYPNEFITSMNEKKVRPKLVEVPGNWNNHNEKYSPFGYGTYHIRIQVPENERRFAFHIVSIHSASKVFINDRLMYESGEVGYTLKKSIPKNLPRTFTFNKEEGKKIIDLFIQVSNFHDIRSGGISREILFGDSNKLLENINVSNSLEVITLAILFLTVFLLLGMYIFVKPKKELFYVAIILLNFSILFMIGIGGKLLHHWIDIPYGINVRLVNGSILIISLLFFKLVYENLSKLYRKITFYLLILNGVCLLSCVFLPINMIHLMSNYFIMILVISMFQAFFVTNKRIEKDVPTQLFFLIALFSLMIHLIMWFQSFLTGKVYIFYPFDLLISIFCLMFTWLKHYQSLYIQMEELNSDLIYAMDSKNIFLSRVAIKLRKPVKEIDNLIDSIMAKSDNLSNKELLEDLSVLEESNHDILILVNNMVELSNSEFSLKRDFVEPLSVTKKIKYCTNIVMKNEFYRDIKVIVDIDNSLDLIYGNSKHFIQLIFQLLFVAKKIIPIGKLKFYTEKTSNNQIVLHVTYTECFVSKYQINIMNMPLHQLLVNDALFESVYGIEMSLIHSLTRLQGGDLFVEKIVNGIHMKFTFDRAKQLELNNGIDFEFIDIDENRFCNSKQSILMLSSDIRQLNSLKTILETKDTIVIQANNSTDALNYIKKYNIDLVICDTILDNSDGFSFVRKVRKENTMIQLPIILVVSTNKYKVELNEVYRAGANDYLEKPIDVAELSAKIKLLIEMKKNVEQAIHFEASWLQAQIEPHFLFNTLNTIISLASEDEEKMEEVFEAFMSLLHSKYHYDNEGKITLQEELELLESYLLIEKTRYGDKLKIVWDVDKTIDLSKIEIIPLSLQPIAENAIKHGILPQTRTGILTIRVAKNLDNKIIVDIEDNGNGTEKTMSDFLQMRYDKLPVGIGLTNTYYRFKKIMGKELKFHSEIDKGTKVSFYLEY